MHAKRRLYPNSTRLVIGTRGIVLVLCLATCAWDARAQLPSCTPRPSPRAHETASPPLRFAFQSRFWLNLHQFLYAQAQARSGRAHRPTVTSSLTDTAGLASSPAASRARWESALQYYVRAVAPLDFIFDSTSIRINDRLSELADDATPPAPDLGGDLAAALIDAAPLYRTLWWPAHDSANRRWIEEIRPLLDGYGEVESSIVTRAFVARAPTEPIRVDVSAYATWAGAYTTEHPSHIIISSRSATNARTRGLESLFHEALHTMDACVEQSVRAAGDRAGVHAPYDVTHALIFYTAGYATQRAIPSYWFRTQPGTVWARSPMATYLPTLDRWWLDYLDGRLDLSTAARHIVSELKPLLADSAR